jgi:hypothetical protein
VGIFDRLRPKPAPRSHSTDDDIVQRAAEALGIQLPDPKLGFVDATHHYTEFVEEVKTLKREGRLDEAEQILLRCCDATEHEAAVMSWGGPAPWYYEQLAIIYRKQKAPRKEVAILERYVSNTGIAEANRNTTGSQLLQRLEKARALRDVSGEDPGLDPDTR